jgi:sulfur-oxidizing protein SoxY
MRTIQSLPRRQAMLAALAAGVAGGSGVRAEEADDPWPSLAAQIFDDRPIDDGSDIVALDAPYRAEDAAVVPIGIQVLGAAADAQVVRAITLVIDGNPSPVAAKFVLGANSGTRSLSTRIRVDSYTNIHAVAEMAYHGLVATERFVKAAGGCSAPAAKQEVAGIPLGTMRLRQFPQGAGVGADPDRREVQLMIRHPNYSGMQMDQVSRLYVPAHFVSTVRIWQGDDLLLQVESGISISENPEFRFDYRPNGAAGFRAEVEDNEGRSFKDSWSVSRV